MCGGDFMSKNPEEAMDFLSYVAEVSRGWDEPNEGEFMAMTRRLEELELQKMHEVQAVAETSMQVKSCPICQSYEHLVEECPIIPVVREMFGDQANVVGQFKSNNNASYENTYNSSWRNHPNFSWKARAPQYQQLAQPSQQSSSLEQAIVNLSKIISNTQSQGSLTEHSARKGRFPSQPHQNPKGIHEVEIHEGESSQVKDVKALITLRSGQKVEHQHPSHMFEEKRNKEGGGNERKEERFMIGGKVVEKALLDLGASCEFATILCLQAIGTCKSLRKKKKVQKRVSELPNVFATLQGWRRREEILPLFNKEEGEAVEEETPKLNLKPLPVELKYTYLEEIINVLLLYLHLLLIIRRFLYLKFSRVVPKKSGITVVQNEKGEEIATRLTSGAGESLWPSFLLFLGRYSGYFQIEIDEEDQEKTTFTCPFGTYAYRRMPFGLCNAPATFQR
ncbi:hypothetical protein CK203_063493 [Vitis vinifera]|uniref:Reverse transcriptase domain-containing protein n=1 Tax=Vitis vinifera TaxID=29760 RepID=A0A438G6U2_VITVI|nr:hypothetical protein CK203_063493 [Vitis vinifera]